MSTISGLAKTIRESGESEQYDLASYSKLQLDNLMQDAFGTAIVSSIPLRYSFVVGAGRGQGRGKYAENLPKMVAESCRGIGFEDNKHADTCWECHSCYKYQHDTDKNLKIIHVFPTIDRPAENSTKKSVSAAGGRLYLATICGFGKFKGLVEEKVWSFTQKNNLLNGLKANKKIIASAEQKLIKMEELDEIEDVLYNAVSMDVVEQKCAYLEKQMEDLVGQEMLTASEIKIVVKKIGKKVKGLNKKLNKAKTEKKKVKLQGQIEILGAKKGAIANARPAVWENNQDKEIDKLRHKLKQIEIIENSNRARTPSDLKKLKSKEQITEKLEGILNEEAGWFDEAEEEN